MAHNIYTNSRKLTLFIFKRDYVRIIIWIASIIFITASVAFALTDMYENPADLQNMAESMKNPALVAMAGPAYGTDNFHLGAMFSHEMLVFTILAVIMMNIFFVVRHTRKDEERGRIEVIRSLPVGRLSNLTATTTGAVIVNLLLAILTTFILYVLKIEHIDFAGSLLFGAALGISGMLFAAVTALFVQLCAGSKAASGYAFTFMGICYLLRAIGDISSEALSLISPLGLVLRIQAYVNNDWWPILILLGETILVTILAFYLNGIRDLDQGFIPAKPGRKNASPLLLSPLGLSLKLVRGQLIGWAAGMYILGIAYGSVFGDLESFFKDNDLFQQLLQAGADFDLTEQFVTMLMSIIAIMSAIPAISIMFKLRSEEKRNHMEALIATPISRSKAMGGYFVISALCSAAMLFLSAFGLWAAESMVMDDPFSLGLLTKACMVYLPSVLVMVGISVAMIGFFPEKSAFVYIYLGFSFIAVYFGPLLKLPDWAAKLSPFGHVSKLPTENMNWVQFIIMTVIALLFIAAGFIGYQKRDLKS